MYVRVCVCVGGGMSWAEGKHVIPWLCWRSLCRSEQEGARRGWEQTGSPRSPASEGGETRVEVR